MISSIEQLEFRIFHSLFCSAFRIQKNAFSFDEYVAKVFQRFVLELIEIRLIDWFYVITFLCLNLLRVKLNLHYFSCEEGDSPCDDRRNIYLFTIIGTFSFNVLQYRTSWLMVVLTRSSLLCSRMCLFACYLGFENRYLFARVLLSAAGDLAAPGAQHYAQARHHLTPALRQVYRNIGEERSRAK